MKREARSAKRGAHAMKRQTRPATRSVARGIRHRSPAILGAIMALLLGLGGGVAYAYYGATGTGTGTALVGRPVTLRVTAETGAADLVPGGTGAAYFTLTNQNTFGVTLNQVATGATVLSDNPGACPSTDISIDPALPYTFTPAVTVGPDTTSTSRSIANLVMLSGSAPSTCQGVTFSVTFTLSGASA
jgi:hypothetical protein